MPRPVVPACRILWSAVALATAIAASMPAFAQDQAAPPAATSAAIRKLGTVSVIDGTNLTIAVDKAPAPVIISVPAAAPVLQLAPGSTDLKTAQPSTFANIAVGDRVLVTGKPGDGDAVIATRVILIKSADIAQRNAASQQDWQRRGSGGIVNTVDPAAGTITITLRSQKIQLNTASTTIYRRYAPGSVKFEEATLSKLADLHPGDQLRVRGDKSADGTSIQAEEIVSGAFRNIAGTVTSANASTITVKDLAAKKDVIVHLSPESDLRNLPPEMAARFAARSHPAGDAAPAGNARPAPAQTAQTSAQSPAAEGAHRGPGAGGDLSQLIPHLPTTTVTELKPGAALMIVASDSADSTLTAITVLSGVEPILAATPRGSQPITLSPINTGAMEAGGGVQ